MERLQPAANCATSLNRVVITTPRRDYETPHFTTRKQNAIIQIGGAFSKRDHPETTVTGVGASLNNTAAVLEGTGPFYCGFRGSSELNSGILSIFVRDIGWYRCYFHGGAHLAKIAVLGTGFYQCFYQRPGIQLTVRQGVGPYFCYFQGIRHAHGFIHGRPPMLELNNFLYFLGSVNFALRPISGSPLAEGQVLGIYNFGPEGSDNNYGLLQASESFNVRLPPLPVIGDNSTLLQQLKESNTEASIGQQGLYQYHYSGTDFDIGRANRFGSVAYNLIRTFAEHTFTAQLFLLEFSGQGGLPQDDRDIAQGWLTYRYTLPDLAPTTMPSYFQAFLVGQYNYLNYDFTTERSHGLDFIQWILYYTQIFPGFRTGDTLTVNLNIMTQLNSDMGPAYVPDDGQHLMGLVEDLLFMTLVQITYNFVAQEGRVTGLVHLHVINQYYLTESKEEPPGYVQLATFYSKTYRPFEDMSITAMWSVTTLMEYVFGQQELSNGALRLLGNVVIDTTRFLDQEFPLGPNVELNARPSTVTLLGLVQCIWFGIRRFRPVCFLQIYVFYVGSIVGVAPVQGSGQSVILAQFYQELRI